MQLGILLLNAILCFGSIWISSKVLLASSLFICSLSFALICRKISVLELLPYFLWLTIAVVMIPEYAIAVVLVVQVQLFLAHREFLGRKGLSEKARQLRSLIPKEALVFVDMDIEAKTPSDQIQEGHLVRLHAGDTAPNDGVITFGSGIFDESAVSNDLDPKIKGLGNQVLAGSKLKNGSLIFRVSSSFGHSFVEKLANCLETSYSNTKWYFLFDILPILTAIYIYATSKDFTKASIPLFFAFGYALSIASKIRSNVFRLHAATLGIAAEDFLRIANIGSCVSSARPLLKESKCQWLESEGEWSEDAILQFVGPLARKLEDEASYAVLHEMQKRKISLEILDSFDIYSGNVVGIIQGQEFEWISYAKAVEIKIPLEKHTDFLNKHMNEGNLVRVLLQEKKLKGIMAFQHKVRSQAIEGKQLLDQMGVPFVLVTPQLTEELQDLKLFTLRHRATKNEEVKGILDKLNSEHLSPVWLDSRDYTVDFPSFSGAFSKLTSPLAHFAHLQLVAVFQLLALAQHFRKKEVSFILQFLLLQGLSLVYFLNQPPHWGALASLLFLTVGYLQAKWIAYPTGV